MKKLLCAALAVCVLPTAAHAAAGPTVSANANASAKVVTPLSITCSNMNFGKLAPLLLLPSTVTLPAQGSPILDPQDIVVPGTQTSAIPSNCNVIGEHMLTYTVTLPTSASLSNGAQTMLLDNFTISTQLDPNPLDRILDSGAPGAAFDGFGVGARLNVAAAQAPGVYTGTFPVQVQYN